MSGSKMEKLVCPICSSPDVVREVSDAKDYLTGETFGVAKCQGCDVVFTEMPPADMGKYYPSFYRRYSPLVLRILRQFYSLRVGAWVKGRTPGKVLEIGCGDGYMLSEFQRRGWDVLGVERTEHDADVARKTSNVPVIHGDIASLSNQLGDFDMIVLFHSLEHFRSPVEVLTCCRQHLKAGGLLVVAVPNFASWQAGFCREKWLHLDVPRHLCHYTPRSLGALLGRMGFSNLSFQFVSFEHDPYGWLQSLLNMLGFPQGALTESLMKRSRISFRGTAMVLLSCLLIGPACFLAVLSWVAGRGALMEVKATK